MPDEFVWREDVEKEVEYLREGARNLSDFYHRAKSQGAPSTLLEELGMVWKGLDDSKKRLEALLPCFTPEPRSFR